MPEPSKEGSEGVSEIVYFFHIHPILIIYRCVL